MSWFGCFYQFDCELDKSREQIYTINIYNNTICKQITEVGLLKHMYTIECMYLWDTCTHECHINNYYSICNMYLHRYSATCPKGPIREPRESGLCRQMVFIWRCTYISIFETMHSIHVHSFNSGRLGQVSL